MSSPGTQGRRAGGVYTQVWDGYSLAERDRRWNAVRAKAAEAGFDCIFVPTGDGINARYLTQFRASSVVLPTDGREPIVVTDRGSSNAWLPEPRLTTREWSEPMAQALMDCGMERARIGVSGLRGGRFGHVSQPEGVVCHSAFVEVCRRLPGARFENATDVLGQVRYVKSAEEIGAIRKAAAIAHAGTEEFLRQAAAGADETLIRARVVGLMLRLGSEYYPPRLMPSGSSLTAEVRAVWGTQVVAIKATPPGPSPAELEWFTSALQLLQPGRRFRDLFQAHPDAVLQSVGPGDDGPLVSGGAGADLLDIPVQPNTAFTLATAGSARPVLVQEHGAALI
jgi:hypothetical protein